MPPDLIYSIAIQLYTCLEIGKLMLDSWAMCAWNLTMFLSLLWYSLTNQTDITYDMTDVFLLILSR